MAELSRKRRSMARLCLVWGRLMASGLPLSAQTKTPVGTWWDHQIQGLEHYYTSHGVCGFPLTAEDRALIVEAYAKVNQFSMEDAQTALDKSSSTIDEDT